MGVGDAERTLERIASAPRWTSAARADEVKDRLCGVSDRLRGVSERLRDPSVVQGRVQEAAVAACDSIRGQIDQYTKAEAFKVNRENQKWGNEAIAFVRSQRDSLPGDHLDERTRNTVLTATTEVGLSVPGLGVVTGLLGRAGVEIVEGRLAANRDQAARDLLKRVRANYLSKVVPKVHMPDPIADPPAVASGAGAGFGVSGPSGGAGAGRGAGRGAGLAGAGLAGAGVVGAGLAGAGASSVGSVVPGSVSAGAGAGSGAGRGRGPGSGSGSGAGAGSGSWSGSGGSGSGSGSDGSGSGGSGSDGRGPGSGWSSGPGVSVDSALGSSSWGVSSPSGGGLAGGVPSVGRMVGAAGVVAGGVGAVGGAALGRASAGGFFANPGVRATPVGSGSSLRGATGLAAGLRGAGSGSGAGAGAGSGAGASAGRPVVGGGSPASEERGRKRRGLGLIAPRLEDDWEFNEKPLAAMPGRRLPEDQDKDQ